MKPADEDGWEDLQSIWRAGEEADDRSLAREVRRRAHGGRLVFLIEAIICCVGLVAAGLLASRRSWILAVAVAAYSLFGLGLSYAVRSSIWRVETGDVASALERLISQAQSDLRVSRAGLYMCAAALVLMAVLAARAAYRRPSMDELIGLLTMVAIALVGLAGVIVVSALRIERSRARLERLTAMGGSGVLEGPDPIGRTLGRRSGGLARDPTPDAAAGLED
jgi:hypothetical protein